MKNLYHHYKQIFKINIISNRTFLSIPKDISIPKVCTQNTSSIKNYFEDLKSNFIETLNAQAELFMKQQKELFFTEINLLKKTLNFTQTQRQITFT